MSRWPGTRGSLPGENLRAATVVAVAAVLLAWFVWRTFVSPPPREYDLDFKDARWIQTAESSPTAYFRKSFYVLPGLSQVWMGLAATDSYQLYVNGNEVSEDTFLSAAVTGQFDLTGILLPGKNVIAVRVARLSYPGSAQVIVRLGYRDLADRWHEIPSGTDWKASSIPPDIPGSLSWYEPPIDETLWPDARESDENPLPRLGTSADPRVMQAYPAGRWISAPDPDRKDVYFRKRLAVHPAREEAWIQLAATGEFELLVNGRLAVSRNEATPGWDVYPIRDWVREGENSLQVRVRTETGVPSMIADVLSVKPDGTVLPIPTDGNWEVSYRENESGGKERWRPAQVLASYGEPPWGFMTKTLRLSEMSTPLDSMRAASGSLVAAGVILGVFVLWIAPSLLWSRFRNEEIGRSLNRDALYHWIFILAAAILLLFSFDVRFHPDEIFQPRVLFGLILLLLALKPLAWTAAAFDAPRPNPPPRESAPRNFGAAWTIGWAGIVLAGFFIRLHDLEAVSLHHDEVSILKMTQGIFTSGYPHARIGHFDKPLTTYEVVPYPIALSLALFGEEEWAARLPSAVFGTITIGLIGLMGRRLFGPFAGLLSALIYAFQPWSVSWAQNAFYPQQTQLYALLTFWMFYEALRTRPVHRGYLVWTTIFFTLMYLSWEGSGFVLPALGLIFLVSRWGNWSWIKERRIWECSAFVLIVIAVQYSFRVLSGYPYLTVGTGLSEVGLPSPFFLDPQYDPLFYYNNFLALENHVPLTVAVALGLVFSPGRPAVRYLASLLFILLFAYTNFLSASATRYAYFLQPLLILPAAAFVAWTAQKIRDLASDGGRFVAGSARAFGWALAAVLFFSTNNWVLLPYRLSSSPALPYQFSRPGVYSIDYRGTGLYVKDRWRPGDIVIPGIPHTFEQYAGIKPDYYINTLLAQRIVYDSGFSTPIFVDRFAGKPVIRNPEELRGVLYPAKRVWVVAAPIPLFTGLNESFVLDILRQRGRIVYESYDAQVYLWEGVTTGPAGRPSGSIDPPVVPPQNGYPLRIPD